MAKRRFFSGDPEALVGQRFSNLTVISVDRPRGKHLTAFCRCDCGNEKFVRAVHVLDGAQISCGCRRNPLKHGMSGTRPYRIWRNMHARCGNPNNNAYSNYGGRGVTVCERWNSFENFLADMGESPVGQSIERINNNGNYEPGNCRWASHIEQMNNTSRNRFVEYIGRPMTVAEVLRETSCQTPERTVRSRIDRGLSIEEAMK